MERFLPYEKRLPQIKEGYRLGCLLTRASLLVAFSIRLLRSPFQLCYCLLSFLKTSSSTPETTRRRYGRGRCQRCRNRTTIPRLGRFVTFAAVSSAMVAIPPCAGLDGEEATTAHLFSCDDLVQLQRTFHQTLIYYRFPLRGDLFIGVIF